MALMLQNDEFMDELRRNREFMDALDVGELVGGSLGMRWMLVSWWEGVCGGSV